MGMVTCAHCARNPCICEDLKNYLGLRGAMWLDDFLRYYREHPEAIPDFSAGHMQEYVGPLKVVTDADLDAR